MSSKNVGILGSYLVEDNLLKFIKKGLKTDTTKTAKEKKTIEDLLQNAAAKYIDLKRFREDFNLLEADYKEVLEYFLLNFQEVSMYGTRIYTEYRCGAFDSFEDDAFEEGYAEALEEEKLEKKRSRRKI